jgi:hypothetical protein
MFTIRKDQMEAFSPKDRETLAAHIYHHLLDSNPETLRGLPTIHALDMIMTSIKRAEGHGFSEPEHLMGFVSVMFEMAPNFDEEPTFEKILADSKRTPEQRWEALFEDKPEIEQAWERVDQPDFYSANDWLAPEDRM